MSRLITTHLPRGRSFAINFALRWFGRSFRDVIALPDGRKFYITTISPVKRHLFFTNKYEERDTQIIMRLLKDGDYFFDIGSNFGWYSIAVCDVVAPKGRVVAFDMVPELMAEFKRNIDLNNANNMITVENIALGDHEGVVDYLYSSDTEMGNFQPEMLKDGSKEISTSALKHGHARMTTLDQYVTERAILRIDCMKIDIDGAEVPLLRGARTTLATLQPAIVIEVSERGQQAQGHTCREIFEELAQHGYSFYSIRFALRQISPLEFGNVTKEDVLCLPPHKVHLIAQLGHNLSRDELPRSE